MSVFVETYYILIRMSLKYVPKAPISNNPALLMIIAWRRAALISLFSMVLADKHTARQGHIASAVGSGDEKTLQKWLSSVKLTLRIIGFPIQAHIFNNDNAWHIPLLCVKSCHQVISIVHRFVQLHQLTVVNIEFVTSKGSDIIDIELNLRRGVCRSQKPTSEVITMKKV